MSRKSRRRSWGSITIVTKTKHVVRWIENTTDGRVRKSKTLECTYREADRFLAERRMEVEAPPAMTVKALWDDHERPVMADRLASGRMSNRTARQYDSCWAKHVAPRWGGTPCTEVRPLDIQKWLLEIPRTSAKTARIVLKKTLDHAVMFELIATNPADKKFRYADSERRDRSVYTQAQLEQLAEVVRGSACEVPFILCAFAGMRVGEACGVPIENVEFGDEAASIAITSQLADDGELRARLKTRASKRTVGLPKPWCDRLRDIVADLPDHALWANDNGAGEPVPRYVVARTWERLVKASAVPYLPMQSLRPSFETIMHWKGGVPIEQVARIMGHTQASTTVGHYDRPGGDELVSVAVEAASRLSEIS